jgi:hypothetical protein
LWGGDREDENSARVQGKIKERERKERDNEIDD